MPESCANSTSCPWICENMVGVEGVGEGA